MVSKAREDFPEPDGPVTTVKVRRGISRSKPFRLCCLAPRMMMLSFTYSIYSRVSGCAEQNPIPAPKASRAACRHRDRRDRRKLQKIGGNYGRSYELPPFPLITSPLFSAVAALRSLRSLCREAIRRSEGLESPH